MIYRIIKFIFTPQINYNLFKDEEEMPPLENEEAEDSKPEVFFRNLDILIGNKRLPLKGLRNVSSI